MNDLPNSDSEPVQSEQATEAVIVSEPKRPLGTLFVAALFLLSGLWIGWQRLYPFVQAYSSGANVAIHPSYYVALIRDGFSSATAVLGALGLLFGWKAGWWLSILNAYWRLVIQGVLTLLGAFVAAASPDAGPQVGKAFAALIAGMFFAIFVLYLQKKSVLSYYRIHVHRAVLNVVLVVFCIGVALGLDILWAMTQR